MVGYNYNATYMNGKLLQIALASLPQFLDECNLRINADGLRISRMDSNQVVLCDFHLPRDSFLRFPAAGIPERVVGISLNVFFKQPLSWLTSDPVKIKICNRFIEFEQKINLSVRTFRIKTQGAYNEEEDAEDFDENLYAQAEMNTKLFTKLISSHADFGPDLKISIDRQTLTINAVDGHYAQGSTVLKRQSTPDSHSNLQITRYRSGRTSRILNSKMVKSILSASDLSNEIEIRISDGPVGFCFRLADEGGHLTYWIAPKIESR